jgi:hypothetical protein
MDAPVIPPKAQLNDSGYQQQVQNDLSEREPDWNLANGKVDSDPKSSESGEIDRFPHRKCKKVYLIAP